MEILKEQYQKESFHLQRLYKRRKIVNGEVRSTIGSIMTTPDYGYVREDWSKWY